jgi:TM2 domain-containing membrane protein YozV
VKTKSEGLAAVLSFLIPGLGQIYNGEIGKGIGILVLAIILGILFFLLVTMLILLILWIWNIYDAYSTAQQINRNAMSQAGYYQYPR